MDDLSEPTDIKILNSEFRKVLRKSKLRRKERSKRGNRRDNELRVWEI